MKPPSITNRIYDFMKEKSQFYQPFLLKNLYRQFPDIKDGTIREMMRRLVGEKKVIKIKNGLYFLPNPERVLQSYAVNVMNIIDSVYLKNQDNEFIGYRSGINFANLLGLTSQTASVEVIYSNNVSTRKREIKIQNNRLMINAPRVKITNQNYKLLQLLDLLTDFEKVSEYELDQVQSKLLAYINAIQISSIELNRIVEAYPLAAQVKFYKIGAVNVITQLS
jgi:hypothetical protein